MHSQRAFVSFASFPRACGHSRGKNRRRHIGGISYNASATKRSPGVLERTCRLQDSFATGRGALMPSPGSKQQGERSRDKLSLLRSHPLFRDLPPGVIEHIGSYLETPPV